MFLIEQASGRYCALCEGDDYWTDPLKLQKQIDFLDQNLDYSICFHNVQILKDKGLQENPKKRIPETTTIKELARRNYIHTPSVVYRNGLIHKLPDYFKIAPVGDYFLHMLNAKYGKIKYIDEIMAVYREHHHTSYWSSKKQIEREKIWIEFIGEIKDNFDTEVQSILENQIAKLKYRRMSFIQKIKFRAKEVFYPKN
jgi:glycosyltransferase involved in cell wall biosynthesis